MVGSSRRDLERDRSSKGPQLGDGFVVLGVKVRQQLGVSGGNRAIDVATSSGLQGRPVAPDR